MGNWKSWAIALLGAAAVLLAVFLLRRKPAAATPSLDRDPWVAALDALPATINAIGGLFHGEGGGHPSDYNDPDALMTPGWA